MPARRSTPPRRLPRRRRKGPPERPLAPHGEQIGVSRARQGAPSGLTWSGSALASVEEMEPDDERTQAVSARREELAAALARRRDDIVQRWLAHVMVDVAVSGIDPTDLRDAIPD